METKRITYRIDWIKIISLKKLNIGKHITKITTKPPKPQMNKIKDEKEVTLDCKKYRVIRKYFENLYSKLDKFLDT